MENNSENIVEEINSESEVFPGEMLKSKLANLPTNPGVYIYKNINEKIIYVGKAKNLRNRVRSYFHSGRIPDAKTKAMLGKIADMEVIVTDSEAEALILEDTLVKKYKPKYNILLRDDKSFPYVRVTNEEYPRVFATRKIVRDGSKYYGPFTEVRHLKQMMSVLRNLFYLRSCDYNITKNSIEQKKYKVCLDYHIKKCEGPCEGLVSKEKYNENVKMAIQVLNGKTREVEKQLEQEMEQLSGDMKFEEAALLRNRYYILKEYLSHQKIVTTELIDRDVFGLARIGNDACTLVFKIRDGKLIGKRHFIILNAAEQSDEAIIQTTIEKWYLESEFVPKELFLPCNPEQSEFITDWLKEKSGKTVELLVPKLGDKKKLVSMAATNAEFMLREYHLAIAKREQVVGHSVSALQRDLRLSKPPIRIECFDNSHIQGSDIVSSCVVFIDGKPKKSEYRKFQVKTVNKNDDFAAMQEVVRRRYTRLLEEKAPLPDLIVIDGGKGQLSHALEILKELNIADKISIIGLAKRLDEVFVPGKKDSIMLPKSSSGLKLIQRIRDEAHRFAITYHRLLREKRTLQTELTDIPGIGEKTAQKLLIQLGSVENIRNADYEKLIEIAGNKAAKSIDGYFKNN